MQCDGFSGAQKAFCLRHSPGAVTRAFRTYQDLRSSCDWFTRPAVQREKHTSSSRWATTAMHERGVLSNTPNLTEIEDLLPSQNISSCKVAIAEDEYWQIHRLGPFNTVGGYDWIEVNLDDVLETTAETHVHVGASYMAPVDAAGAAIEHPPLHVHHMHFTESFQSYTDALGAQGQESYYYQTSGHSHADDFTFHIHGDSACSEENGGVGCYLLGMPRGYGFRFPAGKELFFNAEINDVRRRGSPVLSWYVEIGAHIFVNSSSMTAVSKLFACGEIGVAPGVPRSPADLRQGLATLPAEDTLVWAGFPMHLAGRFVHFGQGISHAHQAYSKGYWILAATPEQAGFHAKPYSDNLQNEQFVLSRYGLTHEAVKAHILRSLRAARESSHGAAGLTPRVLCTAGGGLEYEPSSDDGSIAGYYDRMPPLSCANDSAVHYAQFDVITMVYFFGPVHPENPPMELPYRMHACIGAYMVDDRSAAGDFSAYMANYRYVNWWHEPEFAYNYWIDNMILDDAGARFFRSRLWLNAHPDQLLYIAVTLLVYALIALLGSCCVVRCLRKCFGSSSKKKTLL